MRRTEKIIVAARHGFGMSPADDAMLFFKKTFKSAKKGFKKHVVDRGKKYVNKAGTLSTTAGTS